MKDTPFFRDSNISLGLVFICKNESHCIAETLESCLPYINYYFVADTGSTDDTKAVISRFMQKHKVPGEIIDIPWVNFGQARSELLKRCQEKDATTYVLMMDADDLIVGPLSLEPLRKKCDSYSLRLKSGTTNYKRQQIFKLKGNKWHYRGAVHEYAANDTPNSTSEFIDGSYYVDSRRLGNRNKDPTQKQRRDIEMLLGELKEQPHNARDMFYLALCYFYLGECSDAIPWFEKRLLYRNFWEEEWWATLRLAECYVRTDKPDKAKVLLQQALAIYPKRAEQNHDLSKLLEKEKKFTEALEVARQGLKIPRPTDNLLWFLEDVYDYHLLWQTFRLAAKCKLYHEVLELWPRLEAQKNQSDFSHNKDRMTKILAKAHQKLGLAFPEEAAVTGGTRGGHSPPVLSAPQGGRASHGGKEGSTRSPDQVMSLIRNYVSLRYQEPFYAWTSSWKDSIQKGFEQTLAQVPSFLSLPAPPCALGFLTSSS